ncbi:hypothetical protein LTR84_007285 [Exophiala bonariae]|uniref:Uncharacterized protein n=1 Tax=Exophiala bonariae TaxID=1690606 RepID=A0AAV9MZD3_9EURO|nr:hypothetical protein LTR84_007285 [Exophiala bonariae]
MAPRKGKDHCTKDRSLSVQRVSLPAVLRPFQAGIVKSRTPVTARNTPVAGHAIPPTTQDSPQGGSLPNVSDTSQTPSTMRNTSRIPATAQNATVLQEAMITVPTIQTPSRAQYGRDIIERVANHSRLGGSQARSLRVPRVSAAATFAKEAQQEHLHEYILKNEAEINPTTSTSRMHGGVRLLSGMSRQRKPHRYGYAYSRPHGVTASDEDDRLAIAELLETEAWLASNTAAAIHTVIHLDIQLLDFVTRRAIQSRFSLKVDNNLTNAQFWTALKVAFTKQFPRSTLRPTPETFIYEYVPKLKSADDPPKPGFHANCLVSDTSSSNRTFQEFIGFYMREARERAVHIYAATKDQAKQTRIGHFKTSRYDAGGRVRAVTHASIPREAAVFARVSLVFNQTLI